MKKYKCYICGKHKTKENFYVDKSRGNGASSRCKECNKKYDKENKKNRVQYYKNYRENNREKLRAKYKIFYYVRKGVIKKQSCEICSNKAEAHHDDYSKPLEVRWFCHKHHMEFHKK